MTSVPLPAIPTERSATVALPSEIETGLENHYLDGWLVGPWPVRFATARQYLAAFAADPDENPLKVEAGVRMLTYLLEQLGERDITCVEQAALYRCTCHPQWVAAATLWLGAHGEVFEEFVDAEPAWTLFGIRFLQLYGGIPA